MKQKHYPHWALAVLVGITIVAAIHTPPIKLPSPPATRTVILAGDHRDEAVQGAADATIVVVEYVSTTCAHCAAFHTKIWPQLREAYVASGKVRWIRRPWVSDTQAMAEWMLAICMPERGNDILDAFLKASFDGDYSRKRLERIVNELKLDQAATKACLADQAILDRIDADKKIASAQFGIPGTPTFFLNDDRIIGDAPAQEFELKIAHAIRAANGK